MDQEFVARARWVLQDRDATAATLRELDMEIAMLCMEIGRMTPDELRRAVREYADG